MTNSQDNAAAPNGDRSVAGEGFDAVDAVFAARLDGLSQSGASTMRPPEAFLAAVAGRRRTRLATRLSVGFGLAAAVVIAGLAWRAVRPAADQLPPDTIVHEEFESDDPEVWARLIGHARSRPEAIATLPTTGSAGDEVVMRAGYSDVLLREDAGPQ